MSGLAKKLPGNTALAKPVEKIYLEIDLITPRVSSRPGGRRCPGFKTRFSKNQPVNSKVISFLCVVPVLVWGFQWHRQIQLDHKTATVPLGATYDLVEQIMGKPSDLFETEGSGFYCYSSGFPFSLIHPNEWQFEFQQGRLISKQSSPTRPSW